MSDRSLAELEEFFLALSDGTRLRLLALMCESEVSVGFLSDQLGQSQPKISRHLAYLRSAGLVETRRDGKWIYYHISETLSRVASRSLADALEWVAILSGESARPVAFKPVERQIQAETETEYDSITENDYSTNDLEIYLL